MVNVVFEVTNPPAAPCATTVSLYAVLAVSGVAGVVVIVLLLTAGGGNMTTPAGLLASIRMTSTVLPGAPLKVTEIVGLVDTPVAPSACVMLLTAKLPVLIEPPPPVPDAGGVGAPGIVAPPAGAVPLWVLSTPPVSVDPKVAVSAVHALTFAVPVSVACWVERTILCFAASHRVPGLGCDDRESGEAAGWFEGSPPFGV